MIKEIVARLSRWGLAWAAAPELKPACFTGVTIGRLAIDINAMTPTEELHFEACQSCRERLEIALRQYFTARRIDREDRLSKKSRKR